MQRRHASYRFVMYYFRLLTHTILTFKSRSQVSKLTSLLSALSFDDKPDKTSKAVSIKPFTPGFTVLRHMTSYTRFILISRMDLVTCSTRCLLRRLRLEAYFRVVLCDREGSFAVLKW